MLPRRPLPCSFAAFLLAAALSVAGPFGAGPLEAQTCWAYVDDEPAMPGIECVQKSDLTSSCSWPSDCTTVPSSDSQTLLQMHTAWHECFGNVGGNSPPPDRGQRWYAFHRQFEFDFNLWRMENGLDPIEQHDWCPDMNLPWGHHGAGRNPDAPNPHPADCGEGTGRPANDQCVECVPMPQCVFHADAGPISCPNAPSSSCSTPDGGVDLTYTSLAEFPNVDTVSLVLDAFFHGRMHSAVSVGSRSFADTVDWGNDGMVDNDDCANSDCSPRDPMFWRLHKALDDVVRAWQDSKAVDVMIVMDRSGSMAGSDASGASKLEAAVDAADYFGDLLEAGRADGATNRIGIVTYASSASLALPLTDVDGTLRDPGAPFPTALDGIEASGPGGCTGIGAGIERAIQELCSGGDCSDEPATPPAGTNARKAILLMTDGLENRPPCLQPAGSSGGSGCGSQCFGAQLAYDDLGFTQLVGVGFGSTGSLNGDLLTLLAERQGGIYVQNPNGPDDDLKYFYAMAFGQLSDEFLLVDPRGHLPAGESQTPPVEYGSCEGDGKLTFTSGWQHPVDPGALRLLVNDPSGDLVRPGPSNVEASEDSLWATTRVRLPHRGRADGTWRAQLVRPHRQYVNGFAPDAFARPAEGVRIVRRQIQRLCSDGCQRTLLFEKGRIGETSVYRGAVKRERAAGLLDEVVAVDDAPELHRRLARDQWDLLVYARTGEDEAEPYDEALARRLCRGQRAVLTDTRIRSAAGILECAGVKAAEPLNWTAMDGDGGLFSGRVRLDNPGHDVTSVSLRTGRRVQATVARGDAPAVVATADSGRAHNWFVDVLGWGIGKLTPVRSKLTRLTGEELTAAVRILPSFHRRGGWDHVDARVEVEHPTVGVGTLLSELGKSEPVRMEGEVLDGRAAAADRLDIPTRTATFRLYDDGTHGDINPGNGHWTGVLPGLGSVDGTYRLRFVFELTADGCTTRREVNRSMFVDVGVDPEASGVRVTPVDSVERGDQRLVRVDLRPADSFGNLLGPGRAGDVSCGPGDGCLVRRVEDHLDGSYTVEALVPRGLPGVRLEGFGTAFDVPVPCEDCVRLDRLTVTPRRVLEHGRATAVVRLTGRAAPFDRKREGTAVRLTSSDPQVVRVPAVAVVPAGRTFVEVPVEVRHLHEEPRQINLSAHFGGEVRTASLFVRPERRTAAPTLPEKRDSVPRYPGTEVRPNPAPPASRPDPPGTADRRGPASPATAESPDADRLLEGPSLGAGDAPVVVVEFSDYACPYCRAFHAGTFPRLMDQYVEPGQVRWVVRDFPLTEIHPGAGRAAEAAACAAEQGRLREARSELYGSDPDLPAGRLLEVGRQVAPDAEAFEACFLERARRETVRRSRAAGEAAGVRGTPTFFVYRRESGGQPVLAEIVRGARPPSHFVRVLDRVLAAP